MELYQLRNFAAIAGAGQLTRAAERLHVSQPALSAQLKALEDELDLTLFERVPTGMLLTAAGKRVLASALVVLAAAQDLRHEARALGRAHPGQVTGKAVIGTLSDPDFIRLGNFMSAAVKRYPLLELELHQEVTGAALQRVADGTLDASYFYGELGDAAVTGLRLGDVVYRIAAPAAWAGQVREAGWKDIAALPWIIPPAISTHHKLAYAALRAHGVEPSRVVEADQEAVVASLVVSGVGIALIREDMALEKEAGGEICLWSDTRLVTPLWFIQLREREFDPLIQALLAVQRDVWGLRAGLPEASHAPQLQSA